jgi:hypothetical protein
MGLLLTSTEKSGVPASCQLPCVAEQNCGPVIGLFQTDLELACDFNCAEYPLRAKGPKGGEK